jgi:hypothetical protein
LTIATQGTGQFNFYKSDMSHEKEKKAKVSYLRIAASEALEKRTVPKYVNLMEVSYWLSFARFDGA